MTEKKSIEIILEQLPGVTEKEVVSLVRHIENINRKNKADLKGQDIGLDVWVPNQKSIKEIINGGVRIIDVPRCIKDFIEFAKTKNWDNKDNLNAKFIGHVNIMKSKGLICIKE